MSIKSSPADIDPLDLVDPERFARRGYPHAVWTRLRTEAPVAWFEPPGFQTFWAITKHEDVTALAADPMRFSSAHGLVLGPPNAITPPSEMVVVVDPPRHRPMRKLVSGRFTPRAVRAHRDDIERIATEILDEIATGGETSEIDFVDAVSAPVPIAVIAWILGVPREDWQLLYRLTNEIIGANDPEFRRPGESPGKTTKRARGELIAYLEDLIEARRREPRDDLVSELLGMELEGEPLNQEQLLAYCELMVEAGNETTRNAISGGLIAFAEHPEAWARLVAEPDLLSSAMEEVLRWVTPITHFTRYATEDVEVRGQTVRAGEHVALFFASANRDEEVFEAPFEFRIDRKPNRHVAFGIGEHVCLGAHMARVELEAVFRHLIQRLDHFELAGEVERLASAVNGSIKRLPIRYALR